MAHKTLDFGSLSHSLRRVRGGNDALHWLSSHADVDSRGDDLESDLQAPFAVAQRVLRAAARLLAEKKDDGSEAVPGLPRIIQLLVIAVVKERSRRCEALMSTAIEARVTCVAVMQQPRRAHVSRRV